MAFNAMNKFLSKNKSNDNEDSFEENVKNSFKRAKEHTNILENQLKAQKDIIIKQNAQIKLLLTKIDEINKNIDEIRPKLPPKEKSSSGNRGVYSAQTQQLSTSYSALIQQQPEKSPHLRKMPITKQEIMEMFKLLSKQELMAFLTIYQLEEEIGYITYLDIATHLKLSEGCIRTYISSLVRRGLPIQKIRHHNKHIFLSIPDDFRKLGLKDELMRLYYKPQYKDQKTLVDNFNS